jgi:hypothetical protein
MRLQMRGRLRLRLWRRLCRGRLHLLPVVGSLPTLLAWCDANFGFAALKRFAVPLTQVVVAGSDQVRPGHERSVVRRCPVVAKVRVLTS